ncbi:butyrophilin 2 isoform X2 [Labeo rohita]|uniref:Butyrophilin 2 isoform X2 n=1 Tax=Labeo rohita TaxID=84645 RepID=A0A498NM88_LABRO|nr:butyrophilin 2 isoform X2 [Labeo rohita]
MQNKILLLMIADGLIVHGPSGPLVAPLGCSVVLPCYVNELLLMEGLEVEWRKTDSGILVHLYQDGESRPEAQQQDYHDRAHFFTDQIQHGNFSLRLDNLTAEDEGRYTCRVYNQRDSGETVVQIKDVERLLVSGSSRSISASVGEDVTLNCSVDSHITPEHTEEVSWRKKDEDKDVLVLLYQNNDTFSDSSDERYRDRVEFFTAEIPKGNFSLRLKSVRTEDKGVYMCQVFAGGLSANATACLELGCAVGELNPKIVPLGSSVVLPCYGDKRLFNKGLKIQHGNFSLRLDNLTAEDEGQYTCTIYSQQKSVFSAETHLVLKLLRLVFRLQMFLVVCPNILMCLAFVLWGVSEGSLFELFYCGALYFLRPLMLLGAALYVHDFTVNGDRTVGDLRIIVFSSEGLFALSLLSLQVFKPLTLSSPDNDIQAPLVSQATASDISSDLVFNLQMFLIFCPNIMMFVAFVVWGVSEGFLYIYKFWGRDGVHHDGISRMHETCAGKGGTMLSPGQFTIAYEASTILITFITCNLCDPCWTVTIAYEASTILITFITCNLCDPCWTGNLAY